MKDANKIPVMNYFLKICFLLGLLEESPTVFEMKALFIQNVLFLMVTFLCV